ncbi:MAG TPA: ATPase domain-containing protein, partial [Candidatus Diapherotrites archaeon]|nr:ATPase domain-containing protein [Candidatus Diapherotrites archaeon]
MAKKKISEEISSNSFSKLNDFLNKIAPDGEILDINPIAKIDEWISTGSYILNAALSGSIFGGLPNRRSLVLAGEEGTGKTFIALSICRNAQKMGYDIIYFDSEGAIDIDFVSRLGVDTSRVRLQPVNTIEEFSHISSRIVEQFNEMKQKGETPPKIMIVLDSLGNLTSIKEAEDTI